VRIGAATGRASRERASRRRASRESASLERGRDQQEGNKFKMI